MKNLAVVPDILSAADELMTAICKKLPSQGTPDDVLSVISSHREEIKNISMKTQPLISSLNLQEAVEEKYSEIKHWSKNHPNYALPIVAWDYFVLAIVTSTEESLFSNVVKIIPIVDRSFTDYFIEMN